MPSRADPGYGRRRRADPRRLLINNSPYVTPWVLHSASQFRPGPPPALTSAQYATDYNEIKSLGATNSTTRTLNKRTSRSSSPRGAGTALNSVVKQAVA